jgi:hypothetical protein
MVGQYTTQSGGASVPEPGGNLYYGTVSSISNTKLKVSVPMLGFVSTPCDYLNGYGNDRYTVGERVVVGFLEGGKQHLVVFGRVNHRHVVFPTYQQYSALLARMETLESQVETLQGQVSSLSGQLNSHTH